MNKYFLAIKYWIRGDSWGEALAFAEYITRWCRKNKNRGGKKM